MTDDDRGFELSILNYSVHPLGHALDVVGRPGGGFTWPGRSITRTLRPGSNSWSSARAGLHILRSKVKPWSRTSGGVAIGAALVVCR